MMKLKQAVLFSFVILSLLFTVFSIRFIMPVEASPGGEHTDYTLTLDMPLKDAQIDSLFALDENLGAHWRQDFGFRNETTDTACRILVQFDLPPALSGANITSATLKLSNYAPWSGGYPSGEAVRACRVTHDWVEGTGTGEAPTQDGVTWNEYNYSDGLTTATNNWGTPGGDYTLADSSAFTIPPYPEPWAADWTVTNIVKGWANGTYSNCGFLIKLDNELGTSKGYSFYSKEYAEEHGYGAPKLEITYTVPTIESCNSVGERKDYFLLGETLYVNGSGFSPSTTYSFYIVVDQENWPDGMSIPERVADTASSIVSNVDGAISPTDVWHNPQTAGKYDIVIDVNGNGKYDAYVDTLDNDDVEITAGFVILASAKVAAPTFGPAGGTYSSSQTVTLSCATSGATIRYTVDGSEPSASSTVYSSPISVGVTTTIKAKAFKSGMTDSDTATATYTIQPAGGVVATPTFSPVSGTYSSSQSVTISCGTSGATVQYTLDGSEPTSSSATYSGPIAISATTTVKAKAVKSGMTDSATASATYAISVQPSTNVIPPEAFYAAAAIGIAAIAAITIFALRKPKKQQPSQTIPSSFSPAAPPPFLFSDHRD